MSLPAAEIVWTIVVAGGTGSRTGRAKQYEQVGSDVVAAELATMRDGLIELYRKPAGAAATGLVFVTAVESSTPPRESVRAGLVEVPHSATIICVHDAARPFASLQLFAAVIEAVHDGADAAVPGVAVTDTIKLVDADNVVIDTPPRSALVAVQTPQAFRAAVLRAHGGDATDDAALVELCGGRVVVVDGEKTNRKITHLDDLAWARELAEKEGR